MHIEFSGLLSALRQQLDEVEATNTKLILIVGAGRSGKTKLLQSLAHELSSEPINVGLELGRRLSGIPAKDRGFSTSEVLRELTDQSASGSPILLDNLEVLFEPSLQISPVELLKKLAHQRRVVAVWPGELHGDRLVYADMAHVEYREDSRNGIVIFEIFE